MNPYKSKCLWLAAELKKQPYSNECMNTQRQEGGTWHFLIMFEGASGGKRKNITYEVRHFETLVGYLQ